MQDLDLLSRLLGLEPPWRMTRAELKLERGRIEALVEYEGEGRCPLCDRVMPRHDHRERTWRHLDIFQYAFYVTARAPRVRCQEHGVQQLPVPWAEGRSGFTALFERAAISLLLQMSITGAARHLKVSWDEMDGIMMRSVARGLSRREGRLIRFIGVDEKAIKKRHKYFTIVSDLESGTVLYVGRGRKQEALDAFWRKLSAAQLAAVEGVAMDMWAPYFESTTTYLPDAASKIVFDKYHLVSYLTKAVDLTRRRTMRDTSLDREALKGTKYSWLRNPRNMTNEQRRKVSSLALRYRSLGRAWAIKESFAHFWTYVRESSARSFFKSWFGWASRSRIPAMIDVAYTLKRHFENIITYLRLRITNASAEALNAKLQWIKFQARGYRNEERFERAIMFHCGGLDLYPAHHKV